MNSVNEATESHFTNKNQLINTATMYCLSQMGISIEKAKDAPRAVVKEYVLQEDYVLEFTYEGVTLYTLRENIATHKLTLEIFTSDILSKNVGEADTSNFLTGVSSLNLDPNIDSLVNEHLWELI